MHVFLFWNSVTCCWNTDEEGRLIPTPSLQPLQPQGRTQRSQGAEAIPRRGLRPSMSSLPRRSPHCHPPFCHLENLVEAPRKTVPQSSPAKKKIMEFLVWHAALDGCSLHGDPHHSPPLPRHCHCALQSDNTWHLSSVVSRSTRISDPVDQNIPPNWWIQFFFTLLAVTTDIGRFFFQMWPM